MGCFLACFGSSKDGRRRRKQRGKVQPRDQQRNSGSRPVQFPVSSGQEIPAKPVASVSDVLDKSEETLSCSTRKKVTFDSNVKTYEHVSSPPDDDDADAGEETLRESRDMVESDDNYEKLSQVQCASEDSSVASSIRSYPPNHRYQNCRDSDDEDGDLDCNVSDLTDDDYDDDHDGDEDEGQDSSEIYEGDDEIEETMAVRPTPSEVCNSEHMRRESPVAEMNPTKLNVNARDRGVYIHSVLNPVENLTQWKAVKAKGTPLPKHRKENLSFDQEARMSFDTAPASKEVSFSFKAKPNETKKSTQEVAVDASLSNWLPSSVTTPIEKKSAMTLDSVQVETRVVKGFMSSPRSQEDRPILGALTVEELRQFSAKSSPRKSPSRSPDEMPIIGTVGTYWSQSDSVGNSCSTASFKGIPNTTSKYGEDKKVNWHSTPFETRLERALNRGAHQL
ncbi:serine/threonine-protein phosphatase 4 regulatory subunit 2 isoform X1 [Syzygium oleosum]|uniref:serine/threonine-protein phosphatase 4 regulatory subunit 2 isoform X1 n=1 Tax=Syzygium oleosum TaxID=219896 RepID=UPI0024B92E15|nr:serine/threonine-protein phosphatase 4 regulatory subunit 2 isoform X1 [Syzygium oleosum]